MRELTFKGFLAKYVRALSAEGTNSLYKLAEEAAEDNPRLREPLLLYSIYTGKQAVLARACKHKSLYAEYCDLFAYKAEDMTKLLAAGDLALKEDYHKVWRSYNSQKNRSKADDRTKELMRQKVKRLQAQNGVSNYRIYADLKLNPGNLNAWLKHGESHKISLETARRILRYVEEASRT